MPDFDDIQLAKFKREVKRVEGRLEHEPEFAAKVRARAEAEEFAAAVRRDPSYREVIVWERRLVREIAYRTSCVAAVVFEAQGRPHEVAEWHALSAPTFINDESAEDYIRALRELRP
jgi:hypothetical protein